MKQVKIPKQLPKLIEVRTNVKGGYAMAAVCPCLEPGVRRYPCFTTTGTGAVDRSSLSTSTSTITPGLVPGPSDCGCDTI